MVITGNVKEAEYLKTKEREVILKDTEWISRAAFYGSRNLSRVDLPEGLKHIGEYAFAECPKLKEIYLPDSLGRIDSCAFHCKVTFIGAFSSRSFVAKVDPKYWNDKEWTVIPRVKVFCHAGTYAQEWCISNKVKYELIGEVNRVEL